MPDYNVTLWKQIADEQGIDYSGYSPASLRYEKTWIKIVGEAATGTTLYITPPSKEVRIQLEAESMPGYGTTLAGARRLYIRWDKICNSPITNNSK